MAAPLVYEVTHLLAWLLLHIKEKLFYKTLKHISITLTRLNVKLQNNCNQRLFVIVLTVWHYTFLAYQHFQIWRKYEEK